MKTKLITIQIVALLLLIWMIGACDSTDSSAPDGNIPPTTIISGGPEPFGKSSYLADLKWFGEDMDGSVDHFDFAMDDTTEWFQSTLTESVFVVTSNDDIISDTVRFEDGTSQISDLHSRYHTFFIRSVDDKGAVDPTPAFLTFNSTTVAPSTRITSGPSGDSGRAVSFHWEGQDPDHPTSAVAAYEYFHSTQGEIKEKYIYDPSLSEGLIDQVWNQLHWTRVGSDTMSVVLQNLESGSGDHRHIFCVRSIDEAGAIEQIPNAHLENGNYRNWGVVTNPVGSVVIRSNVMGTAGGNMDHVGNIFEGTRVVFNWNANLGAYDGVVTGYSYAYDNPIWSPWNLESINYPEDMSEAFIPSLGNHTFYVRAKDEAGLVTTAEFPFVVHHGPTSLEETRIFMLQDFHMEAFGDFYPSPEKYRSFWSDSILINFDHTILDPREEDSDDIPIRDLSRSTTLILTTDDFESGEYPQVATWHDQNINPIWSYVNSGGNLLLCGFMPAWNFLIDNDFIDTGFVPVRDPCFKWSSPLNCGSNLIWFTPQLSDSFPHPLYEYCALETTWLDETADYLWSAKALLTNLPDLHVDSTRSLNFVRDGLWNCERLTLRDDKGAIPIYGYSRTKNPDDWEDPVGVWIPSSGTSGHVVYLGMPLYYFGPADVKELVETILMTIFRERPMD